MKIDIILLAAGLSRRMGEKNKLLLPFGDSTILETSLNKLINAKIGHISLVIGHEKERILQMLEKLKNADPLSIIENLEYEKGMTSSIQTGIRELRMENGEWTSIGTMICLGDMPLISSKEYQYLAHQFNNFYKKDKEAIVQPTYQGQRGNPTIFSKYYSEDILNLKFAEGCKPIVQTHKEHLYLVEMSTPSVLLDADTPEAYQKLLAQTL